MKFLLPFVVVIALVMAYTAIFDTNKETRDEAKTILLLMGAITFLVAVIID